MYKYSLYLLVIDNGTGMIIPGFSFSSWSWCRRGNSGRTTVPSWGEFGPGTSGWYKLKMTWRRVPVVIPWQSRLINSKIQRVSSTTFKFTPRLSQRHNREQIRLDRYFWTSIYRIGWYPLQSTSSYLSTLRWICSFLSAKRVLISTRTFTGSHSTTYLPASTRWSAKWSLGYWIPSMALSMRPSASGVNRYPALKICKLKGTESYSIFL